MFPLPNRQIGSYRLVRRIGVGGMGEVYLAEDNRMGITRQVAIKTIRAEVDLYPDQAATRDAEKLFRREMQAIAQLDHPYILPLYDFGEEQIEGTLLTYMVMPFRPEGAFTNWLQKRGTAKLLSPAEVTHFVEQAALALQHAHTRGLIHQDVKPTNFLLRERSDQPLPDILLSDFGIVKMATATATQSVRGTPTYMAPEQWNGHPVPATDQYALAIMAYLLLTRQLPFKGSMEQVMRQHLDDNPQAPRSLNPALPADLDAVILQALKKSPENRFASIAAFANAFKQAAIQPTTSTPPLIVKLPPYEARLQSSKEQPGSALPTIPPGPNLLISEQPKTVLPATPPRLTPITHTVEATPYSQRNATKPPLIAGRDISPHVSSKPGTTSIPRSRKGAMIKGALIIGALLIVLSLCVVVGATPINMKHSKQNTWVVQESGTSEILYNVTTSNFTAVDTPLMAVGTNGTILTSKDDGISWMSQESSTSQILYSTSYTDVQLTDTQLVAVGANGTILTSSGVGTPPWTSQKSGTSQSLYSAISMDTQFVAVGANGTILTSPDGITWTSQKSGTSQTLYSITQYTHYTFDTDNQLVTDTQLVAVGANGTILTSPDGITWTSQKSGTSQTLYNVIYPDNQLVMDAQFVAVGANGTILTTPDGITWTSQKSGTSQTLYSVDAGVVTFVAVGTNGTILTSPDGIIPWTSQKSGTSQTLYSVTDYLAHSDSADHFVVVGANGTVLTSSISR